MRAIQRSLFFTLLSFTALTMGCSLNLEDDPNAVKIEISNISTESDRDAVQEVLKGMTDGSSHTILSTYSNDTMSITLSPVSDLDAFEEGIDFGEVTSVDGRTVTVKFEKAP